MTRPREFEKPTGVRDLPPELAIRKRLIENHVQERFQRWGYQEVVTPALEYFETVGNASAIQEHKLFKLLDRQGQTLVLRPDQTAPIARMAASIMKEEPLPMRLFYHANVFRAQEREAGRHAEFFQSGVELIGGENPEEDAEVIALATESLRVCQISPIQLVVGHIGLLEGLLKQYVHSDQEVARLKESLGRRDFVSYREQVKELPLDEESGEGLLSLLRLRGDPSILRRICKQVTSPSVKAASQHLMGMWEALEDWGVADFVRLDLSLVGSLDYYTGFYFEGYGADGVYLVSGGRYDGLLGQFGRPAPARGFALKTDRLMEASRGYWADHKEKLAVVYPQAMRRQAFAQADELRRQGNSVALFKVEANQELPSKVQDFSRMIRLEVSRDG